MEIAGLIKEIPVEALLKLAESEEQTGALFLKSDHGIGEVLFENGLIYSADSPFVRERLGQRLVLEGVIHASDLHQALRDQENGQDRLLGEILLQKKLLPEKRVKQVVEQQIEEAVLHLLMWDKGQFAFERTSPDRSHKISIRPKALLKEKKKRIEELKSFSVKGPMEKIEDHPHSQIHQKFRREIMHTISKAKIFEPRIMVLLVEGDSKWRMMVQEELAKQNFQVKGVSSTEKAQFEIERMLEKRYSPIVNTDIDFPFQKKSMKLEGLDFMKNLHKKYPAVPILVSTSYPISNLRRKILFAGGIFCLVKPDLSILSSNNFEQIFQGFVRELAYCLDVSIQQYYQEYFQERAEIIKNDLLEDLYNSKAELVRLGGQIIKDSKVQENFHNISNILVQERDVYLAIEGVLNFMISHFDHVALFLWGKRYLNGYIGKSALRADFSEKIKNISVEFKNIRFLQKLYVEKMLFAGPPPKEGAYCNFLDRFLEKRPQWHLLYPVEVMGKVVGMWYADTISQGEKSLHTQTFVSFANLISLALKMDIEGD